MRRTHPEQLISAYHTQTSLTCRIKYEGVVKNIVEQKVVGRDTKLSTETVVAAVGSDNGIKLHLKQTRCLRTELCQESGKPHCRATFLVGAGTVNLTGWYLLL